MKKLIVLVAVVLLVGTTAFAQMMSDVTISGKVEERWMQDFGAKSFSDVGDNIVELKFDAMVDDNAKAYIELEENAAQLGDPTLANVFDRANFTLNLGGIYDLPVGVSVITGFDEYDQFDAVKVSPSESEDVIGSDMNVWGNQIDVAVNDMIAIRTLWANDFALEYWSAGVAVTYDPVYVEASYVNIDATEQGKGNIESGVEFTTDVADGMNVAAAGTIKYDLEDTASGDAMFYYGVAGAFTYNEMITVAAILKGETDHEAAYAQIDVKAMPTEMITAYLFAGIGLDDAVYPETFDGAEVAVEAKVGAAVFTIGLMYVPDGGTGEANEKSDFQTPSTDSTSLFFRGKLEF
jgi:hypothetical protein